MAFFQEARCLRCGSTLPLQALWGLGRVHDRQLPSRLRLLTRSGLLKGKIGISCPNCGATFRVVQTRIRFVFALVWTVLLGVAAYLEDWKSHPHVPVVQQKPLAVLAVLIAAFVIFLLLRIYTPRLALVRPPRSGEQLTFPLQSANDPRP
jgi:hypothetical protein